MERAVCFLERLGNLHDAFDAVEGFQLVGVNAARVASQTEDGHLRADNRADGYAARNHGIGNGVDFLLGRALLQDDNHGVQPPASIIIRSNGRKKARKPAKELPRLMFSSIAAAAASRYVNLPGEKRRERKRKQHRQHHGENSSVRRHHCRVFGFIIVRSSRACQGQDCTFAVFRAKSLPKLTCIEWHSSILGHAQLSFRKISGKSCNPLDNQPIWAL